MGECTGEEILGEVEVGEGGAEGDVEWEGGVDGVVGEVEGGEVGEATTEKGGREWACDVGVGEVQARHGGVGWVAGDAGPVAGGGITAVPRGEGGVWVIHQRLELVKVNTLLVQTHNHNGCCW